MRFIDTLIGAVALVLLATTMGVILNRASTDPVGLLTPFRPRLPARVGEIDAPTARRFALLGALFVDAREPEAYRAGHIPGALNLPAEQVEDRPVAGDLLARIREARMVVIYCDGPECLASFHVARRLRVLGLENLWLMPVGWPGWEAAGNPRTTGDTP
ncbi:MAG: hypothetical protein FJX76_22850 [Armatimonadetes bacterium]|nr:hypothetical protein [Armatimonadota bacterium]